ncbi:CYP2R1 [Bugula neritina]|uniref:CYP2R1 n=1 Tax=Bugula neritina TaxID=10212 RepID=A0A7J7KRM7_BUGNE|nr:CYP2R1 [Bugula neritina]
MSSSLVVSLFLGSRTVSCKDRVSMPYTDAVLLETLRKASVAGAGLPHTLEKEMVIDGVTIPAGADLMINLDSVLFDEEVFEDPQSFKPERFLTGDITLKKQRTIPFGIGRRACLGDGLAKMEFFLFFVTFLQRYDINIPEGLTVTDEPKKYSFIVNTPNPYKVVFSRR